MAFEIRPLAQNETGLASRLVWHSFKPKKISGWPRYAYHSLLATMTLDDFSPSGYYAPESYFYGAFEGKQLVGFGTARNTYVHEKAGAAKAVYVDLMLVHPQYRHQGISHGLLTAILQSKLAAGAKYVIAERRLRTRVWSVSRIMSNLR